MQRTRNPISRFVIGLGVCVGAIVMTRPVTTLGQGSPSLHTVVQGRRAVAGDVLVKFRRTLRRDEHDRLGREVDADRNEDVGGAGVRLIHSRSQQTEALLNFLTRHPDVAYAEPNYLLQATSTPNDPDFASLWGLLNTATPGADIGATSAWNTSTGSTANVVGVVDSGIDYTHPDLAANVWTAPAPFTVTVGFRTVSCDAGTHGFNAITNSCDPMDDYSHGTHVSGTIGAIGNNGVGVTGVNWTARLMGLKFLDSTGLGTTANAISAIEFAIQAKAITGVNVRVLSNSWGGSGFSQALLDEINKANTSDMLFVTSSGNNGSNNDTTPAYPANYDAPNIITVTATDNLDGRASFANYGATTVHLGAPGAGILSTVPGGGYDIASGTSMAVPHVSGAAALLLSVCGFDTPTLKATILNNVDLIPSMRGVTTTGGRLDVGRAMRACVSNSATAVRLTSFSATSSSGGVLFNWHTGYEADNLGFRIYRERQQQRVRLTPGLIAGSSLAAGTGGKGRDGYAYSWFNAEPEQSSTTTYWLEAVDLHGQSEWYGPFKRNVSSDIPARSLDNQRRRSKLLKELGAPKAASTTSSPRTTGSSNPLVPVSSDGAVATRPVDRESATVRAVSQAKAMRARVRSLARAADAVDVAMERQWTLAADRTIKIDVRATGWYRIGQPELAAAGLNPSADPQSLRLFADGVEQPIVVNARRPDRFTAADSLEFYGTGVDTPSTDTRVYWLASGVGHGVRVSQVDARTRPSEPLLSFPFTVTRQDRTILFAALQNGDADSFFGDLVSSDPVDETLALTHVAHVAGNATVEVALQGVTDAADAGLPGGAHVVEVQVNGLPVGTMTFAGRALEVERYTVPQSQLVDGPNTVTLRASGGDFDVSLVEHVGLTYWHTSEADHNALTVPVQGQQPVAFHGFNGPPRVFDLTSPDAVRELVGSVQGGAGDYTITVRIPDAGRHTVLAVSADAIQAPARVRANVPSSWHQRGGAADYVVITHAAFASSVAPLIKQRAQQGHATALVDVEDVYDEFAFGQKSPWAIKAFLARARASWATPPRFVVLVGNASADPRNYLRASADDPDLDYVPDSDFVPTKLVETRALKTASDDWFADLDEDGIPELAAVGRFSVLTADQAKAVVSKILAYEQAPAAEWMQHVLLVADEKDPSQPDFEAFSRALEPILPAGYQATEVFADQVGGTTAAHAAVAARIADGQLIVNYVGHGSVDVWGKRADLLTRADVAAWHNQHLPLVVAMNCLTGFFQGPFPEESLAEVLQRTPDGGAIAVWGSSGLTDAATQALMNRALFRQIFGGAATLGEAVVAAKRAVSDLDVRRTWVLFGDPAMRLSQVPPPTIRPVVTTTRPDPAGGDGGPRAIPAAGLLPSRPPVADLRLLDVDGDGRADVWLYTAHDGRWFAAPTTSEGTRVWQGAWPLDAQVMAARLSSDRVADVLITDRTMTDWWQGLATGNGSFAWTHGVWPRALPGATVRTADLRGRGRDDVVVYDPGTGRWLAGLADGRGGFAFTQGQWPAGADLHVGDLDGNGRADIVGYNAVTGHLFVARSSGTGQFQTSESNWTAGAAIVVAHLDGPASQLIFYDATSGRWQIQAAASAGGPSAGSPIVASGAWQPGLTLHVADFTGDGRDDVFGYDAESGAWMLAVTRGLGQFDVRDGSWSAGWSVAIGDLNGDGKADVVLYDPASGVTFGAISHDPGVFEYRSSTLPPDAILVGQPR